MVFGGVSLSAGDICSAVHCHQSPTDSPSLPHSPPLSSSCREGCTSCGTGLTTDADGSASSDDCYVPAGWGTARDAQGFLSAAKCPVNTYGRENNTYGLVDVECTKCLDNSHTNQDASTNAAQCLTNSGYGYYGACWALRHSDFVLALTYSFSC